MVLGSLLLLGRDGEIRSSRVFGNCSSKRYLEQLLRHFPKFHPNSDKLKLTDVSTAPRPFIVFANFWP
jgi:hypothetical protein